MEIKHGKLTIIGDIEKLPEGCVERLIDAFDRVYPAIWERFGEGEPFDITYKLHEEAGIAYNAGKTIGLNPLWLVKNPEDIDCMTHELIHAAQHYPTYKHSWLVEGIADYGRGVFGINNEACNWSLPAKYSGGEIKSGYRITAAFLKFVEENYRKDFVDVCHKALREETFTMDLFKEATGLTADELWEAYKNA